MHNNNNKYIYKAQKTKGFYALYIVKHNVQYKKIHTFIQQFKRHNKTFMRMVHIMISYPMAHIFLALIYYTVFSPIKARGVDIFQKGGVYIESNFHGPTWSDHGFNDK